MENEKGLATKNTVYRDIHLKYSLAFILATLGFLKLYSLSPLLFISR
jgi:hypothetical protein